MPEIIFPATTAPSRNPTENGGRLLNAYAEAAPEGSRSKIIIRRAPGLTEEFEVGSADHRGAILVNGVLYVANGTSGYTVTESGGLYTITQLTGTVSGEGRVMFARNMKSGAADVLANTSSGVDVFTSSTVSALADGDLPSSISTCFLDGYFFFAIADGRCFASGLNDTAIAGTDFITAEASPDGLKRGVPKERELLLMGNNSIEFWVNTGNATGFPFSRGPVVNVGLLDTYCVSGFEEGWPGNMIWVGGDRRVYELRGYSHVPISPPHLERLLNEVADTSEIDAHVFVNAGKPCFVLSSNSWTWVYDVSVGKWHERESVDRVNWRCRFGVAAFNKWITFDRDTQKVMSIQDKVHEEVTDKLIWEVQSTQGHSFPARLRVERASFDIVTAVGVDKGRDPIESNPVVTIDWSDDGGRTWGNGLLRTLGTQGEVVEVDVWRCGLTGRYGRQWRLRASDPVEISLLGGAMDVEKRVA